MSDIKFYSIGKLAAKISKISSNYLNEETSKYGINYKQLITLKSLYEGDGKTQENLVEDLHLDKSEVARVIKSLEEEGYITKEKDKNDKRAYNIFLTQKSRKIERELSNILCSWNDYLVGDLSEDEQKIAFEILVKVLQKAKDIKK